MGQLGNISCKEAVRAFGADGTQGLKPSLYMLLTARLKSRALTQSGWSGFWSL